MRTIGVLVFEGFQLLDAAGPIGAFEIAGRYVPGAYDIRVLSRGGGRVASSSGVTLDTLSFAGAGPLEPPDNIGNVWRSPLSISPSAFRGTSAFSNEPRANAVLALVLPLLLPALLLPLLLLPAPLLSLLLLPAPLLPLAAAGVGPLEPPGSITRASLGLGAPPPPPPPQSMLPTDENRRR